MSYQVILFDLDDTLVDFSAAEVVSLRKIHDKFYQSVIYSIFEQAFKEINHNLWSRVGAKENSLLPKDVRFLRFKQLNEQLECSTSAHEVADAYEDYLGEHSEWIPNVKEAIQFLHKKGHILGIITNGLSDSQATKRQRLGLSNWFDCFIVSDEVGIAKPNKEIFALAIEEIASKHNKPVHEFNKNSILMVGDSIISDGHGAMNFGINYCHVHANSSVITQSEATITHHINSVAQLPAYIGYEAEYELI